MTMLILLSTKYVITIYQQCHARKGIIVDYFVGKLLLGSKSSVKLIENQKDTDMFHVEHFLCAVVDLLKK